MRLSFSSTSAQNIFIRVSSLYGEKLSTKSHICYMYLDKDINPLRCSLKLPSIVLIILCLLSSPWVILDVGELEVSSNIHHFSFSWHSNGWLSLNIYLASSLMYVYSGLQCCCVSVSPGLPTSQERLHYRSSLWFCCVDLSCSSLRGLLRKQTLAHI